MYPDLPIADRRTDDLIRLTLPDPPTVIDLPHLFGNDHPVEMEIGVGKGRFLLLAAAARPTTNFIGIEVARAYYEKTLDRLAKRALTNVRLVHGEAGSFVEHCLGPASLAAIHVYFPDPWPKKRHHKRRLIRPAVLEHFARVLTPGGLLRVVTDHADYALVIREALTAAADFEKAPATADLWKLPGMGDYTTLGVTNFEIKYRREGRPIHRFAFQRR
ncbi:MAG TPA: tRNA (guanosine(46)-N7)-methyltransferase TrmB [Acidobacteria bacterium]|nr:tRNA (guanosine(46)-N7)-methyltransferase TrmB [Acidobacteriota bacterium]